MKVLIIPSWYPTKENPVLGIFFKEQAKAIQNTHCDVTVLYPETKSLRYYDSKWEKGITFNEEVGVRTYRYKSYNPLPARIPYTSAFFFYSRLKRLYKEMLKRERKPDLIHAHSCLWGGWAAARLAKEENIPLLITEHSSKLVRNLLKPYEKNEIKKTLADTDILISVGPSLKETLEGFTTKEIYEIPNIVNTQKFQSYKKKTNNNPNKFIFFSLALLTPNKGMDILIKSFAQAFNTNDVELWIGGDGEEKGALEDLVRDLKLESQIKFLGQLERDEVIHYMNECDAFVLASKYETFGVVLIEALACGKPIISTNSGGPESIVNSANGLLVPVDNIEKLSFALNKLHTNYSMYNSEEIRKDCLERFSEEAITNQILRLYNSLA